MKSKINTLLTLDAFGTLFQPLEPIAQSYANAARRYGLSGFSNDEVDANFRKAFKQESTKHPNYGKDVGMRAPAWWGNVIASTIRPLTSSTLPDGLVPDLLRRFGSSEGYMLYPDVQPFFQVLRDHRRLNNGSGLLVGILTNSDDRVPSILASLGLQVSPWRYGAEAADLRARSEISYDIDLVALSYDIGAEKPNKRAFDATREMANGSGYDITQSIHVGDDPGKDCQGAEAAGWIGLLLDRDNMHAHEKLNRVRSLAEIHQHLSI